VQDKRVLRAVDIVSDDPGVQRHDGHDMGLHPSNDATRVEFTAKHLPDGISAMTAKPEWLRH
jgi:hypothetical protein